MKVNVKHCARCEQDHDDLEFAAFTKHPIQHADGVTDTHWAMCPVLNEPILMRIILDSPKKAISPEKIFRVGLFVAFTILATGLTLAILGSIR